MALAPVTGGRATWWTTVRPGHVESGTPYTGLVSDLAANDYLPGYRAKIVTIGNSTGNPAMRTATLERPTGYQFSVSLITASSILLVRPS